MRPKKNSKRNDLQLSIQMGKKMVGGEWSSKERFARTKLVEFMVDMGNSPDALKFYKKKYCTSTSQPPTRRQSTNSKNISWAKRNNI